MSHKNVKKQKLYESPGKAAEEFNFSSPWHFSDFILVVEDQKFHVHKSTLSMWSKMFERMFASDFKEKSSQEIPLPGKKAAEVKVLLTMIYDKEASVNDHNLEILLKFADEYQMEKLTMLCTNYMKNTVLKKETAMHVYALARKFNLTASFKGACMELLKYWVMAQIENNGHYSEFSIEEQFELVSNRTKALEASLMRSDSDRQKLKNYISHYEFIASCKICQSSKTVYCYSDF